MQPEKLPPATQLSMQDKLDLIAHEREVLELLRELATLGFCEGDPVRHIASGAIGRLLITREDPAPHVVVTLPSGSRTAFDSRWRHI
jgi:hypothetical protein